MIDIRTMFPKEKFKSGAPTFTALEVAKLINDLMKKKPHGGARKGAGRKPKEPTTTIRVPISKLECIKKCLSK